MGAFFIILLAVPFLLIAVLTAAAIVATSIRRCDRASIRRASCCRMDLIARRLLGVGVRDTSSDDKDR